MSTTEPTAAQIAELRAATPGGPITMVNLLKFRETAQYESSDQNANEPISGQTAYGLYAEVAKQKIEENGGRVVFLAPTEQLVVGDTEADDWDLIAIIEYPSRAAYLKGFDSDEYQLAIKHRVAGLESRVLVQCAPNLAGTF